MAGMASWSDRAGSLGNTQPGAAIYPSKLSMAIEPTIAEPNPPFVFPAPLSLDGRNEQDRRRSPPTPSAGPGNLRTDPSTLAKRRTASALPSFNFSPASAIEPPSAETSPSPSVPSSPVTIRPGGHRRGGSEFIGGDGKKGGPGLMSTSPTKGDGTLPFPAQHAKANSIVGRRGHAHRRSGAISCHDLSVILKPQVPVPSLRGGSAPTTPAGVEERPAFPTNWSMTAAQEQSVPSPSEDSKVTTPTVQTPVTSETTPKPAVPRARVGFSDTLEFIPRPLSSLSSDTSSSMATVRGHSASASISSINSVLSSSPASARASKRSRTPETDRESEVARPQTAGAVMGSQEPGWKSMAELSKPTLRRPTSASTLPSSRPASEGSCSAKSLSKKGSLPDCKTGAAVAFSNTPFNLSSYASSPPPSPTESCSQTGPEDAQENVNRKASKKTAPKSSKKPKKVKNWAGSILSRKSKSRKQSSKAAIRRSPTPPLNRDAPAAIPTFSNFDSVGVSPRVDRSASPTGPGPQLDTRFQPLPQDSEALSPVIDLDAALGPFNTPSLGGEVSNTLRSGFAKRKMHSSGAVGGFAGPGMHYHRRTESAPEMVAFDFGHFGLHRLGSSSTMADVFEEDEEDAEAEESQPTKAVSSPEDSEGLGIGIQVVDSDGMKDGVAMDWTLPDNSSSRKSSRKDYTGSPELSRSNSSIEAATVSNDPSTQPEKPKSLIEILGKEREEQLRPSSIAKSSDSTITPMTTEEIRQRSSFTEFGTSSPRSSYLNPQTPSSAYSSPFPSPDFPPTSFEAPRVVTASSSFTDDRTINSLLLGEPGPEVRMSVDDVPSLTSSTSTMTSAVNNYAGHFRHGSVYASHGNRSSSSVGIPRARPATHHGKRASLVSLSRLVGSSHGEKSKLSIESRAQPDSPEKPLRERKGKRLSRMMQFFKPKENAR